MNQSEAIKYRHSTRSFTGQPLPPQQREELRRMLNDISSPFNGQVAAVIASTDEASSFKPSTYGVINGARDFILVGYSNDRNSMLSAGYALEKVVLKATELGLGTCWIAGTFKQTSFESLATFDSPEANPRLPLQAIIPVGIPSGKRSLLEKITRTLASSSSRKSMDLLFRTPDNKPLQPSSPFYEPLNLMRLAPSSVNSQPWRAVVSGERVDFYTASKGKLAFLDLGIGLSHFHIGCQENNIKGEFQTHQPEESQIPQGWIYATSYTQNQ